MNFIATYEILKVHELEANQFIEGFDFFGIIEVNQLD
jgi:hypothetical protein